LQRGDELRALEAQTFERSADAKRAQEARDQPSVTSVRRRLYQRLKPSLRSSVRVRSLESARGRKDVRAFEVSCQSRGLSISWRGDTGISAAVPDPVGRNRKACHLPVSAARFVRRGKTGTLDRSEYSPGREFAEAMNGSACMAIRDD
jgi:hypothetical protein